MGVGSAAPSHALVDRLAAQAEEVRESVKFSEWPDIQQAAGAQARRWMRSSTLRWVGLSK
jgi:hypothetical protein